MCVCVCVCEYRMCLWLSLSHLVGFYQTEWGIIWRVLNICDI